MTADEIVEALEPTGLCEPDIIATALHLLRADELGIHDQGTSRVEWLSAMRFHRFPITPHIHVDRMPYSENMWRVRGRNRIGYSLMQAAVQLPDLDGKWSTPKLVIVDGCFPSGALGIWGRDLADRGLASVITATSRRRVQHPDLFGPVIGTTPISVCIPDRDAHMVADLALTEVTYGDVLAGEADEDQLRFPDMKTYALGLALETMVRTMSFEESAVLMLVFRPIRFEAVADERRNSQRRLPGERFQ